MVANCKVGTDINLIPVSAWKSPREYISPARRAKEEHQQHAASQCASICHNASKQTLPHMDKNEMRLLEESPVASPCEKIRLLAVLMNLRWLTELSINSNPSHPCVDNILTLLKESDAGVAHIQWNLQKEK